MRFGLGPVFAYERLVNARRWQTYAARSFIVAALLGAMVTIASSSNGPSMGRPAQAYAKLGEYYFYALVGVELALVMLVAPAATAGAICLDRARGNLAHVMATDLSDSEIVLGKLAARLLPVMGLVACTWPVMALSTLLGGIDPTALTLAFAIIVTVALLGCAIALALSVWARKPHEVILATYAFWLLLLMAWPVGYALALGRFLPALGHCLLVVDPFYLAFAPYRAPGQFGFWEYAWFFAAAIVTSGALVLLAVWRMRPVTTRQASEAGKEPGLGLIGRLGRWLPGPSLDGNPVLWREWHRSRPSRWMTILVALLGGTTGLACCIGAFLVWRDGVASYGPPRPAQLAGVLTGVLGYMIQLIIGLLMLSVLAPLSLSEERQRGSLDVLIATPLSTGAIVLGKWWGTFRLVPLLAIGPGLMAFALATARDAAPPPSAAARLQATSLVVPICGAALLVVTILVHGAAMTSIGLALATWIKRQVRAIVASVCVFVLVAVGWPFLAPNNFQRRGMCSLSPIFAAAGMGVELRSRMNLLPDTFWWIGFWDVGLAAFAIGLVWLTWRTFDQGLGRIPERARTSPVMNDVIAGLGGMMAASSLYIATTIWFLGFRSSGLILPTQLGATCFVLFVVFGLCLLAVGSPLSTSAEPRLDLRDPSVSSPRSTRSIVLTAWWRLFRLLSLMVVGPSLIALALATAAPGDMATPDPPLGARLWTAAMLVMSVLGFGALTIGAGLALGASAKSQSWAVATSVCLFLPVAIAWPLLGTGHVFDELVFRNPRMGPGAWFAWTLVAYIPLVILLLWLTIWALERRSRPQWRARRFASANKEEVATPSGRVCY